MQSKYLSESPKCVSSVQCLVGVAAEVFRPLPNGVIWDPIKPPSRGNMKFAAFSMDKWSHESHKSDYGQNYRYDSDQTCPCSMCSARTLGVLDVDEQRKRFNDVKNTHTTTIYYNLTRTPATQIHAREKKRRQGQKRRKINIYVHTHYLSLSFFLLSTHLDREHLYQVCRTCLIQYDGSSLHCLSLIHI